MEAIIKGLQNSKTTGAGVALGVVNYAATVGGHLPQNGDEWLSFLVSAIFTVLGLLAKDATTGSQPR